jgi:hypothetical protein
LAYRMPATAPKTGIVFAPTALGTGTFIPANVRLQTTTIGGGPTITFPGGTCCAGAVLEGHFVAQGNTSVFIIDKISVPVSTPTGQIMYVTANDPTLIGASAVVVNQGVNQQIQVQIFQAGSGTPLPGAQVGQLILTAATASYNTSIGNGQLPSGTPAPQPPNPITTGCYSAMP